MPFKGITFAGQNVTPKNDGGLYQAHYGDGILWGCSMSLSGDDLVIQSGEFIAGGRVCQVDGATNFDLSTRTLTNGYIQVVLDFDMSKPEGMQWNPHTPLIESATTTFPALTQDDINDTGTLYQVELAVVQISGGNLTSIYSQIGGSFLVATNTITPPSLILNSSAGEHGVLYASPSATNVRLANVNGGTTNSGLDLYDNGNSILFAENSNIIFRPKGRNDNTNQVYIDANGQINGGHTTDFRINTNSTNIASGWQAIESFNLNAGVWLLQAQYSFKPNAPGLFNLQFSEGGTLTDYATGRQSVYANNTSDAFAINVLALLNLTTTKSYVMHIYGSSAHTRYAYKCAIIHLA